MSKTKRYIEGRIDSLAKMSGYSYDFLMDCFNEMLDDYGAIDWKYFVGVTMAHDW